MRPAGVAERVTLGPNRSRLAEAGGREAPSRRAGFLAQLADEQRAPPHALSRARTLCVKQLTAHGGPIRATVGDRGLLAQACVAATDREPPPNLEMDVSKVRKPSNDPTLY